MRVFRNALQIGRIAGIGAFRRTLYKGWRLALIAYLDELSALLLLIRSRIK